MSMRREVIKFVKLGTLPDSNAPEDKIAAHQIALSKIKRPVTDSEAKQLLKCFGPDDCFGLAWTLLHLIESAPSGIPIKSEPAEFENDWKNNFGNGLTAVTEEYDRYPEWIFSSKTTSAPPCSPWMIGAGTRLAGRWTTWLTGLTKT